MRECARSSVKGRSGGRREGGKGKEETGGSYSTIETMEDFPEALSCSSKRQDEIEWPRQSQIFDWRNLIDSFVPRIKHETAVIKFIFTRFITVARRCLRSLFSSIEHDREFFSSLIDGKYVILREFRTQNGILISEYFFFQLTLYRIYHRGCESLYILNNQRFKSR